MFVHVSSGYVRLGQIMTGWYMLYQVRSRYVMLDQV